MQEAALAPPVLGLCLAAALLAAGSALAAADPQELSVEDFTFSGPLGSEGTTIEKVAANHFRVTLGHAPHQPGWNNKLQLTIRQHAKGNPLRLDVCFLGGEAYRLNEYFHSWSYDGKAWHPVQWLHHSTDSKKGDTLEFPIFAEDTVYVGHQAPLSFEDVEAMIAEWRKSPCVTVPVLGQSLGKRSLYRLEITDPASPHPRPSRWVHYFANQHPGEHNSQWRMVGMIDWLLGDEGRDARQHSICHFILMMSPDAPSAGWYRVNAQGVDMNRSYRAAGADPSQAHEAYIVQKDLEALMASDEPVTDVWSMHTCQGIIDPMCLPGPEMGGALGPWTELRDTIRRNDRKPKPLVKPFRVVQTKAGSRTTWTDGPHAQFGLTAVLCEGAGSITTKEENIQSGAVLMKSIAEYYRGLKTPRNP